MQGSRLPHFIGLCCACFCAVLGAAPTLAAQQPVRNVILFVGDGMGVSTVTAARIFDGQMHGRTGEENTLSFERFPHLALVKTYNVDAQVPDSAGTMTALVTGRKTRAGVLSIGPQSVRGDCKAAKRHMLTTLLEEAEQRGLKTGIVSTTRITHATPAAAYAHAADRDWEVDAAVPEEHRADCADIARQFVEFPHGDGVDVVLGGGRAMFLPAATAYPKGEDRTLEQVMADFYHRRLADFYHRRAATANPEVEDRTGTRQDGRNLVQEWLAGGENRHFVFDRAGFEALQASGQVLGLFGASHMKFEADRVPGGEPSLAEMTRFAIDALDDGAGFFLVVEAGRIDHAHHRANAYRALLDTVALADAVAVATTMTNPDDTLVVVTADHSHTLTIAGYPARGNPILGFVADAEGIAAADDAGSPYTTLGYANGPRAVLVDEEDEELAPTHPNYRQRATHPRALETHAGEDVPAYALGIGAEGIRGVMDQHELHAVMRAALFGGSTTMQRD